MFVHQLILLGHSIKSLITNTQSIGKNRFTYVKHRDTLIYKMKSLTTSTFLPVGTRIYKISPMLNIGTLLSK